MLNIKEKLYCLLNFFSENLIENVDSEPLDTNFVNSEQCPRFDEFPEFLYEIYMTERFGNDFKEKIFKSESEYEKHKKLCIKFIYSLNYNKIIKKDFETMCNFISSVDYKLAMRISINGKSSLTEKYLLDDNYHNTMAQVFNDIDNFASSEEELNRIIVDFKLIKDK